MPTNEQVIDALRPVEDPELHRSIVDLGMVRSVDVRGDGTVAVQIALTVAGCPLRNEIQQRVTTAVTALDGANSVALDFTVMNDQEREKVRELVHGHSHGGAPQGGHGHAEGRPVPFLSLIHI